MIISPKTVVDDEKNDEEVKFSFSLFIKNRNFKSHSNSLPSSTFLEREAPPNKRKKNVESENNVQMLQVCHNSQHNRWAKSNDLQLS